MTSESPQPTPGPARRTVFAAVGAVGIAATLTACGESDDKASDTSAPADSGSSDAGGGSSADSGAAGGAGGTELAKTSDIPECGGKVFEAQKVVVTQPTAGTFKAFTAVCTHQGCSVKKIEKNVINCPCHNSNFSAEDGSVKSGPAPKPLAEAKITVNGDSIMLA